MVVGNSKGFVRTWFLQKVNIWFRNYEAFSFTIQFGQPQNFLFLVFFGFLFDNIFSRKFSIKLPNDLRYSIYVFYKGRLPKESFIIELYGK